MFFGITSKHKTADNEISKNSVSLVGFNWSSLESCHALCIKVSVLYEDIRQSAEKIERR